MAIQNINMITPTRMGPAIQSAAPTPGETVQSFASFLGKALEEVNNQQQLSDQASKRIAVGDVQDLHKALILKEQAGVTLDLTIEIRNKAVEAYQEIMRMNI